VRAVLDPNVLISGVVSRAGAPAGVLERWRAGAFELVISEALLSELERAFGYTKLRKRVTTDEASAFVDLLRRGAIVASQPKAGSHRSVDDDYLLALAEAERALLVTGDQHLLELADRAPVITPRAFLEAL
jgi:uncharacterized protein